MAVLTSPGVSVTVTDESFYVSSGQGTIPLIIIATASNKASPTAGAGIAPYTVPSQANLLYLATSQRDLIQNFGNPIFYSSQGTPLHGYELNEYGLWAAYSYLGVASQAYVLRANLDLNALLPTSSAPIGPPVAGTYWFDLGHSIFGVFRANGNASPGAAWNQVTVLVALTANVDVSNVPLSSFGSAGNVCIVPTTANNLLYENIGTSGTASFATNVMTVTSAPTTGVFAVGQVVTATGVALGTTITSLGSGTGGAGTYNLSTSPGTLSAEAVTTSGGTWYQIGSTAWAAQHDTIVTGTVATPTTTINNTVIINSITVTLSGTTAASAVTNINAASITNIIASVATSGALMIDNTAGGNIVIGAGTANTQLGLTAATTLGVTITYNNSATYPSGTTAGSFWMKGNPANHGASWVIKYYNATIAAFTVLSAPFYQFTSSVTDGTAGKDAAAVAALGSPTIGNVYIGYDPATGDMQIRRWSGSQWQSLVYEADFTGPQTAPPAGTLWFNINYAVDIMYGSGTNWLGYRHQFPLTNVAGPLLDGSAPTVQSDGVTALANGDIWIDTSDLENYPLIYTWITTTLTWNLIDNTNHTTPFGIVFADARQDSGPTFTGIVNGGSYAYSSTASADLTLSDYVEPDAPDARTFPAGTLLFNTRYSTNNVKVWTPGYFKAGGLSPTTDYTVSSYTVGGTGYTFPPLTSGNRWVTTSGNKVDGSPYMGRKAQRILIVNALGAVIVANTNIRSEIVFYNLMAAPGYPELIPDFISLNTDLGQTSFCVADTPARLASDGTSIQNWANNAADAAITGEDALTVSDDYTGVYYPWGLSTNLDGTEIMIPPSAIALVTIAYNDQVAYPWYAPAGFTRGLVTNADSVGYLNATTSLFTAVILNQGQRNVMYTNKINPIAYIPNRGLVVYGQKTLDPIASALDRINVARLMNYISYNLNIILRPYLFEPNTNVIRASAKNTADRFFKQLVGLNGLYDFATVCDSSNNTPTTVDANELWIDCAVQPIKTIEFIYVPVRILNTQAVT